MFTVYQVTDAHSADSEVVAELVRVWREAREDHLRFLSDLHDADEDRVYLSGTVLPGNQVWIAEADGCVAGFIAFGQGWVNQLYVAPAFQGRGIGTELLTVAMRCNETLQLWAFEVNVPAIQFYERRGFRIVERTDGAANEAKRPDVRMEWSARGDC